MTDSGIDSSTDTNIATIPADGLTVLVARRRDIDPADATAPALWTYPIDLGQSRAELAAEVEAVARDCAEFTPDSDSDLPAGTDPAQVFIVGVEFAHPDQHDTTVTLLGYRQLVDARFALDTPDGVVRTRRPALLRADAQTLARITELRVGPTTDERYEHLYEVIAGLVALDGIDAVAAAAGPTIDTARIEANLARTRGVSSLELAKLADHYHLDVHKMLTGEPDPFVVSAIGGCVYPYED